MIPVATLVIPGEPRAKARPRHMNGGHSYTPKGTREFEAVVRAAWDAELRPDMPACVRLDVTFYLGTLITDQRARVISREPRDVSDSKQFFSCQRKEVKRVLRILADPQCSAPNHSMAVMTHDESLGCDGKGL